MRDLTYYIATSLDGFIAHEDHSLDGFSWDSGFMGHLVEHYPETLPPPVHAMLETRVETNQHFDTVLMGRKTYEVGLREGLSSPYPTLDQYVFSRTLGQAPDSAVTVIADRAVETIRSLKSQPGKAIWLCGGASLAATLFTAGLIDTVIVKLNPVLFGTGIPLIASRVGPLGLVLVDSTSFPGGHTILQYRVAR